MHLRQVLMFCCFSLFSLFIPRLFPPLQPYMSSTWRATIQRATYFFSTMEASAANTSTLSRMPVYFLGIGGPNFMEDTEHPAYSQLALVGREITTRVKPKAVVVFSAHWQQSPNKIGINVAEETDLIYDFYGFPPHYYEYDYPNKGSSVVAQNVTDRLTAAGMQVERVKRGLDHGVWAGFMVGR